MRDPKPVNLWTPDEVRAAGWAAEARDADGHLMSFVAPGYLHSVVDEWREEGWAITVFGAPKPAEGGA